MTAIEQLEKLLNKAPEYYLDWIRVKMFDEKGNKVSLKQLTKREFKDIRYNKKKKQIEIFV